jgi:hypothetical protein
MLHNGYPVPMDMLQNTDGLGASSSENSAHGASEVGSETGSLAGDFWHDLKSNVESEKDNLKPNVLKSGDLSERRSPGVYQQYRYFLGR